MRLTHVKFWLRIFNRMTVIWQNLGQESVLFWRIFCRYFETDLSFETSFFSFWSLPKVSPKFASKVD